MLRYGFGGSPWPIVHTMCNGHAVRMSLVTTPDDAQQTAIRLSSSAAFYARSALIHVTSDDDRVRGAIDAGVAVEHMAKALLASLSPALLADRNADLDTLLHLTGLGQHAKCSPHEIKTIGAQEACLRCARILPTFTYSRHDQALFTARNGGTHLALTTEDAARESARIMVRLLEPLRAKMDVSRAEFWGDLESVADTLLDEKASQIRAALEMKFAAARSRLQVRLAGLGTSERELVLKALTNRPFDLKDQEQYECPACAQAGVVICDIQDVGQPDFDYEQVDVEDFVYLRGRIDQVAYATSFDCNACGLNLDYEEMSTVGMSTEFDREPRECHPWEFEDWSD